MYKVTTIDGYHAERQHTEEQMATVLSKMMELERQIKIAKEAEVELRKCREQLEELAMEYVGGNDYCVVKEGLEQ
ncbi:hypothetical protein [Mahella australiensis]|uniref:A kinase (PRKA) anchor protein (Yotiao) 9 n=1 Tax=Mahella australiensis (strain DSM 15567 / CIP 107919 / 50-1 BON) TaxID=697281 RepID=F3ZVG5_MAHA5|nr:hypothetical protein [Mahella australiensis]AEE95315.1 A kinase (PRKA) anchor protein (yotiao) 9 [Mahella australiensis 50-1 BON]